MNEIEKLARERCDACEVPGLNRKHTHAEFMAGYLKGIDDGERAQCRKCYNRGYEDGARLGEQDEDTCTTAEATETTEPDGAKDG